MALIDQIQEKAVGGGPAPGGRIAGVLGGPDLPILFRIGPEIVVDMVEHAGIVLMQRSRFEQRIEINRGNAEVLKVIQAVDHPLQVASIAAQAGHCVKIRFAGLSPVEMLVPVDSLFPGLQLIPVAGPGADLPICRKKIRPAAFHVAQLRVITGIPVPKTFREDLVPYRLLGPFRRGSGVIGQPFEAIHQDQKHKNAKDRASAHLRPPFSIRVSSFLSKKTGTYQSRKNKASFFHQAKK